MTDNLNLNNHQNNLLYLNEKEKNSLKYQWFQFTNQKTQVDWIDQEPNLCIYKKHILTFNVVTVLE